jgi:hypothetical protein
MQANIGRRIGDRVLASRALGFLVVIVFAVGCGADKVDRGEACGDSEDCKEGLECVNDTCLSRNRDFYESCIADEECSRGTCAQGFCTDGCSQFYPPGTYNVGDCIVDNDMMYCTNSSGVGCCKITSVVAGGINQEEVSGQCTANP